MRRWRPSTNSPRRRKYNISSLNFTQRTQNIVTSTVFPKRCNLRDFTLSLHQRPAVFPRFAAVPPQSFTRTQKITLFFPAAPTQNHSQIAFLRIPTSKDTAKKNMPSQTPPCTRSFALQLPKPSRCPLFYVIPLSMSRQTLHPKPSAGFRFSLYISNTNTYTLC